MKFKLFDCIKLGFGFYIGHEMGRALDSWLGELYAQFERRKNGM